MSCGGWCIPCSLSSISFCFPFRLPGALLGELSFLGASLKRTASVTTKSVGVVAAIPFKRIVQLQDQNENLFRKFMLLVAEAGIVKLFSAEFRLKTEIIKLKKLLSQSTPIEEEKAVYDTADQEDDQEDDQEVGQEDGQEDDTAAAALASVVAIHVENSMSDTESDYASSECGSEHGSDHSLGRRRKKHPRGRRSGHKIVSKKNKRGHKFKASSNSEVFYRTKVAQAKKSVEEMQAELEREEREMNRLRAKVKGEEVHRKQMEKKMEFMHMKLAAAGLD